MSCAHFHRYLQCVRIVIDAIKNFHSQDSPGCVDDEANIMKKCDARHQVESGNEMFSAVSKVLDRLMTSVLILTILYEDLLIGEQVDELSQVWLVQVVGQADV